jgi:protocatechuate 3,4-dioxygenase beta subunit
VRQRFFTGWIVALVLSGCAPRATSDAAATIELTVTSQPAMAAPTATCDGTPTLAQTEGPYYKAGSPEVTSLVDESSDGQLLLLTGHVLTTTCAPIAGAVVDVWQADEDGVYDNAGFRMRGHMVTDAGGAYAIETVIPGEYPGRTPHIHIKVLDAQGRELLTTQIYLRGVSDQFPDAIYNPDLLAQDLPADAEGRRVVGFDIVVP